MWLCSEARLRNFEHFFAFKYVSSPQLERKFIVTELPSAFLSSGAQFW